ncbi:MAG: elongation factor G [Planctomycetes bacterium]|nr:elongation factor G [Planctomycetota bacterium]
MKALQKTRNIGIIAHIDAGKTTLTERFLFYTGKEHRIGAVDDGTATMDWMEEERERGITITAAATTLLWRGHTVNLIDTPGHVDFTAEVARSLRVLDGAIVVLSGVEGVEAQSETVWHQADEHAVPRLVFVNKLDRVGAGFERVIREIRTRLGRVAVAVQLPIGIEKTLAGVVDLVERCALRFDPATQGATVFREPIPGDLAVLAAKQREALVEAVAEVDDALAERYVAEELVSADELRAAIRRATLKNAIVPVFGGSALHDLGVQPLLDAVVDYLPSPAEVPPARGEVPGAKARIEERFADPGGPFAALAFKTVALRHADLTYLRVYSGSARQGDQVRNVSRGKPERLAQLFRMHANHREAIERIRAGDIVAATGLRMTFTGDTLADRDHPIRFEPIRFPETVIRVAIEPHTTADRERLEAALAALEREDPTFERRLDEETGQLLISGMGELHIEVLVNRVTRDFGVQARVGRPYVAYRQSIRRACAVEGRVDKQAGGRGFFAGVTLEMAPDPEAPRVRFVNGLSREGLPRLFLAAIEEGMRGAVTGPLGYPVIHVRATLRDFALHEVDSSEAAFEEAAVRAFHAGLEAGGVAILEPVMRLEVRTPVECLGEIIRDLNARRATIEESLADRTPALVRVRAPLACLFGYSSAVRSLSQGRAGFSMEPCEFRPVPREEQDRLVV